MKKIILFLFIAGTVGTASAQKSQVFKTNGKAIKGYDVVAFYTNSKPVEGMTQFAYEWNDATWLFSNQAHLDSFKTAPLKYAPQFGGYCAYGAAEGHKAPAQTDTWTILDGKLYFNYNQKVKDSWGKKTGELIPKANLNWEKIKDSE